MDVCKLSESPPPPPGRILFCHGNLWCKFVEIFFLHLTLYLFIFQIWDNTRMDWKFFSISSSHSSSLEFEITPDLVWRMFEPKIFISSSLEFEITPDLAWHMFGPKKIFSISSSHSSSLEFEITLDLAWHMFGLKIVFLHLFISLYISSSLEFKITPDLAWHICLDPIFFHLFILLFISQIWDNTRFGLMSAWTEFWHMFGPKCFVISLSYSSSLKFEITPDLVWCIFGL